MPSSRTPSTPSLPVVAIVGRPNVGKSTLFNRLAGERIAIVEDIPGTTRDRVYATGEWNGRRFTVVDTGGLELEPGTDIEARVQDQARVAMDEADVILFVVDAQVGVAPVDHDVADRLRRAARPVIVVVNKADNPKWEQQGAEFYALGFEPTIAVSAQHGRSTGDLADMIVERLPPEPSAAERAHEHAEVGSELAETELTDVELEELAETDMGAPRVAIVGRPNTGKSTFVNRVLGSDRMIVSEVPGTTRDPIDTAVTFDGEPMILVDTAGIRRRGSIERGIERYSVLRSLKAIDRADVAVVMTDAVEGYTAQDAHVVGHVLDAGKGLVLVLNKWDAVEKDETTADERLHRLRREAPYLSWADIVFTSAKTGARVDRVLAEARRVSEERYRRVPTGELNRVVMDAVREHPPSHVRNRLPKVFYATQVTVAPPTFVVFVNDPELIHFSYRRYLENRIRAAYGFLGTPIRIVLRQRESEQAARRAADGRRRTRTGGARAGGGGRSSPRQPPQRRGHG
jgi:GTP-binding protein